MGETATGQSAARFETARAPSSQSPLRRRIARFLDHRLAVASGLVLIVMAGSALCAPIIAGLLGTDGVTADLFNRLTPASSDHWLGTDEAGAMYSFGCCMAGRSRSRSPWSQP